MPGILPMKVIRIGSNAQSRIAQACDRCRSKKIRCDGIRPQCTQCSNVGFECKTSDKLSRRAFPRGYTESLDDRVRALEAEVRELTALLDEKDEKIDVLSRIHSFSSPPRKGSVSLPFVACEEVKADIKASDEESIQIEAQLPSCPPNLPGSQSCTITLIDAFSRKVSESGDPCPVIDAQLFNTQVKPRAASSVTAKCASTFPPRLLSDQYINIFFQEWAPLLPILHRPTILKFYEQYLADPEAGEWHDKKQAVAQLYLVFDIAALSSISHIKQSTTSYEPQWRKAIHLISSTPSVPTLQYLLLAQLYYLLKADYSYCARYRAIAVSICHEMDFHRIQKYCWLNCLELETRKKIFWCQYTLDKCISASSGAPTLIHESELSTEYPSDVDDENLTEQGFLPGLPGELTKMSSALAFFKICRILSRALDQLVPASIAYRLSMSDVKSISDELDQWLKCIPTHLRMKFLNDKPSTGVISDRSPLLSLAYFFIRNLIHRPVVCHGHGSSASASLVTIADSAKHIVQILQLLEERNMNYTFPVNKTELLLNSGFSLLWQCLELSQDSRLARDTQKSLDIITTLLLRDSPDIAIEFRRITYALVAPKIGSPSFTQSPPQIIPHFVCDHNLMLTPEPKPKSAHRQLQVMASRFSSLTKSHQPRAEEASRRATVPTGGRSFLRPHHRASSQLSLSSTRSLPVFSITSPPTTRTFLDLPPSTVNLDYLPLGDITSPAASYAFQKQVVASSNREWPGNFEGMDSSNSHVYDGMLNGVLQDQISRSRLDLDVSTLTNPHDWLDQEWPVSAIELPTKVASQSALSTSQERMTSGGEEFSGYGSNNGSSSSEQIDLLEGRWQKELEGHYNADT